MSESHDWPSSAATAAVELTNVPAPCAFLMCGIHGGGVIVLSLRLYLDDVSEEAILWVKLLGALSEDGCQPVVRNSCISYIR